MVLKNVLKLLNLFFFKLEIFNKRLSCVCVRNRLFLSVEVGSRGTGRRMLSRFLDPGRQNIL